MAQFSSTPNPAPDPEAAQGEVFCASPTSDLEDANLVAFLQAHQPPVPTVTADLAADLEERLMAAIAAAPLSAQQSVQQPVQPLQQVSPAPTKRKRWKPLLGATLGTVLAGAGWGLWQQLWPQHHLPAHQVAYIETFLLNSWDDALADDIDPTEVFHPEF